jgi:TIR domain
MSLVFINYLTGDGDGIAVLLDRELSRAFGPDKVFRAGRSIPPGADWEAAIHTALRRSRALVAIIGPRWLDTLAPAATPGRSPHWTLQEIQAALAGGTRVIPVLTGQTPPLASDDLPPALAPLAKRQHIRLDHTDIDSAIDRLTTTLAHQVPALTHRRQPC